MTETPETSANESPGSDHPPEQQSTAVAKLPVALDRPISDLDEAWRLATALAFSDLLPVKLRNKPSNALVLMMYGRDLDMTPMQAFQVIYVVNGKPQLSAEAWTALARRAGHKVRWLKSNRQVAEVQIVLKDDEDHPHVEEFTIEDAIAANLCKRDKDGNIIARDDKNNPKPWELYTKRMLKARALAFGMRAVAPEVALGFGVDGEYDDITTDQGPTTVEVQPPTMHQQQTMSQADLQAAVLNAESRFQGQTIPDPPQGGTPDEPNAWEAMETVDAEVVDETPAPPETPAKPARKARRPERREADDAHAGETPPDDDTLFRGLDEQYEQDQGGGSDG